MRGASRVPARVHFDSGYSVCSCHLHIRSGRSPRYPRAAPHAGLCRDRAGSDLDFFVGLSSEEDLFLGKFVQSRAKLPRKDQDLSLSCVAFYDGLAPRYDAELSAKPSDVLARSAFTELVLRLVPAGGALIDFGCGTGID